MIDPNDQYAYVEGRGTITEVERYLPSNYKVELVIRGDHDEPGTCELILVGQDTAGWTLKDYVIPRLASGLWFAEEIQDDEVGQWA